MEKNIALFGKKSEIAVCGRSAENGCGSINNHIVQSVPISRPGFQGTGGGSAGEWTWLCTICNSYPAMKWPYEVVRLPAYRSTSDRGTPAVK